MQLNIDLLDLRTVDRAIQQIEQYQKRVKELIPEFLKRCAEEVKELANQNLNNYGYSGELISEIQNSWVTNEADGTVTLMNTHDKAVYIEFGTGIVGSGQSHEMASESGYKYDVKSHGEKGWRFSQHVDDETPIDLPYGYYEETLVGHARMYWKVHTKGAPATMFLYQAASDFADYKLYKRIWKELIKGK